MATDILPETKTPVPAWRRLLVVAGWFALALLVVSIAVYMVNRGRLISQRDRLIKELDESDPGWRWAGIQAGRPEITLEENSVPRILAILAALPRGWPDHKKMDKFQDLAANMALDAPRKKLLDELVTAAPMPALRARARDLVRYPRGRIDFILTENPYDVLLPDHHKVREAGTLLSLDALDLAQDRQHDEALKASRACLCVSRSLEDDPFVMGQLIRISVAAVAMKAAEKTMALGDASDGALAEFQELLKHEAGRTGMVTAFRAERATAHQVLTLMAAGRLDMRAATGSLPGAGEWWEQTWLSGVAARELTRREHADILKLMTKVVEAARLPAKDQFPLEAEFERAFTTRSVGILARLMLPSIAKAGAAGRRGQASAAAMRALIAVERYRLKHGKWPAKLEDTVPAFLEKVPEDPMNGKPVRYAKWADGVVVYSVGNDRKDDGGDVEAPSIKDFGYRLWDPNKRRAAPPPLQP